MEQVYGLVSVNMKIFQYGSVNTTLTKVDMNFSMNRPTTHHTIISDKSTREKLSN